MPGSYRAPLAALAAVQRLLHPPAPQLEAALRVRSAELSRALDELFSALYDAGDREAADAFVAEHAVVAVAAVALVEPLPWPHRLGIVNHAAGLLDNFFAAAGNYEPRHAALLDDVAGVLHALVGLQVTNGFHASREGALESVLLLLGRLLARAAAPLRPAALARDVSAVLGDAALAAYVHHAALHPLQHLLTSPAAQARVRADAGCVAALRACARDKALGYSFVVTALLCLAALQEDAAEPAATARLLGEEAWRTALCDARLDLECSTVSSCDGGVDGSAPDAPAEGLEEAADAASEAGSEVDSKASTADTEAAEHDFAAYETAPRQVPASLLQRWLRWP